MFYFFTKQLIIKPLFTNSSHQLVHLNFVSIMMILNISILKKLSLNNSAWEFTNHSFFPLIQIDYGRLNNDSQILNNYLYNID